MSLIEHSQIKTTLAKAKVLRRFLEPLIAKAAKKGIEIKSNRVVLTPSQVKEIKQKVIF